MISFLCLLAVRENISIRTQEETEKNRMVQIDTHMKATSHTKNVRLAKSDPLTMLNDYVKNAGESGSMGIVMAYTLP